jgi:ribosomal protein S18 acetylase RimI-like enzyme
VSQELAKETLVVRQGNEVAGFITLGEKQGCGDIGLVAVAEKHRGRGIGSKLVQAALGWFSGQRHSRARVATQGANRTACALYERHGFGLEAAEDVFHFWIE